MIKTQTPYRVNENTTVIIFPHRDINISSMFGSSIMDDKATGKYFIKKDVFDKETGCSVYDTVANNLTLKEARALVERFVKEKLVAV